MTEESDSPLRAYSTKAELVYRHLRENIISGRLPPGQRLVVDQFASELGISKVPVREAVLRLAGEGWIELKPHVGPVVPELLVEEIEETAVIRAALESTAIRYAVEHRTSEYLAALEALVGTMDGATRDLSQEYALLNREYHVLAISTCPIARLRAMCEEMMERTIRYRTAWRVPSYSKAARHEHRQILHAIADGDGATASSLTYSHILTAAEALQCRIGQEAARRSVV
ncbi:MAG: GntR family transcriptional regulator [Candidatus Dormibacteria bacterium]